MAPHLPARASLKAYMVLYHEAMVCSLLEIMMFQLEVAQAAEDSIFELADYCYRKLVHLNGGRYQAATEATEKLDAKKLVELPTEQDLQQKGLEIGFECAGCAVTMLRYLSEHLTQLAPGMMARLLDQQDVILALVPLVENPPFTRRNRQNRTVEKYMGPALKWQAVPAADMPKLTMLEAQLWLTLYNLIMEEQCRNRYEYNEHRRDTVVKLKRHFSEALLDQMPMFKEFKRAVDNLVMLKPPPPKPTVLVFQEPELQKAIIYNIDFGKLAKEQLKTYFNDDEKARLADMQMLAEVYSDEAFDEVLALPKCALCGVEAMQRCSRCKNEWYCGRKCQVSAWKKHKPVCDMVTADRQRQEAAKPVALGPVAGEILTIRTTPTDTLLSLSGTAAIATHEEALSLVSSRPTTGTSAAAGVSAAGSPQAGPATGSPDAAQVAKEDNHAAAAPTKRMIIEVVEEDAP